MRRFLVLQAALGLITLMVVIPAWAQKRGGVLRVFQYDSPASMSIHEEALNSAQNQMMAVFFNDLVIFNVPQNRNRHDRARSGDKVVLECRYDRTHL